MKAYHINSRTRIINEVEYRNLADMKRLVGGYIELAHSWENGDKLYVDEEGLLKRPEYFFRIPEKTDAMAGNGLLVGRKTDEDLTLPPTMSIEELTNKVTFEWRQ